ncbi:MAG: universal stress protein [Proteobacteria bacterium]|nr:universal stress protein [Pseudomonadota bacterium]
MKKYSRILCAVDFSEATPQVAGHAAMIAEAMDARVLVLYVAPSLNRYVDFQVSASSVTDFVESIVSGAERSMEQVLDKYFAGLDVEGGVLTGYPSELIVKSALDEQCDLIVMGTHGRRGVGRLVFGSVAEKVVKNSPIPVLTIKPLAS